VSALLQFDRVSFAYGARPVFAGLSFALPGNGLMALVGPNGAGKSTLLRLAAGLLPVIEGSIAIDGRPVDAWPRRELARTIAFVPQDLEVPFPFTVEQIVAQGRVPYQEWLGGLSQADHIAIERAIRLTSIAHVRTRTMSEISGGERQRVKLAIALAQEPRLLLLDEPLQHLDIGRQSEFLHLLLRLHAGGLSIVAAMHDLSAVHAHFPMTLLLSDKPTATTPGATDGSCEWVFGPTKEVLTQERVMAAFNLNHAQSLESQSHSDEGARSHRRLRPRHRKNWR
jgi:ABC-type cobalamin/Fe3+-siderophores transport system ATPase subunit